MKRSTAALLIAILFHIVIILLFLLLGMRAPEIKKVKPKESRIKVSLKEKPTARKDALEKNKIKEQLGRQLALQSFYDVGAGKVQLKQRTLFGSRIAIQNI